MFLVETPLGSHVSRSVYVNLNLSFAPVSYRAQLWLLCPVVALSVQQRQPHEAWYTGANMKAGPQAASAIVAS